MGEAVEADLLDQQQGFQQRRSLAPRAAHHHLMPAPEAAHRRFQAGTVVGEVLGREQTAFALVKGDDLPGDVASIEGVAGGGQPGGPAAIAGRLFLIDHVADGFCQIRLHELVAQLRRLAAGQEDRRVLRPARIIGLMGADGLGEQRVHREAFGGEADRRGGDVAEAHCPVAFECGDPGIRRSGNDGAQHAFRDAAAMFAHEKLRIERARPMAQAGNGFNCAIRQPQDDRRHPGEIHQVGLQNAERDAGGAAGVDRVATGLQDREAGHRCEIMPGRHRVAGAIDGGTIRRHACASSGGVSSLRQLRRIAMPAGRQVGEASPPQYRPGIRRDVRAQYAS